jgi:hypothetical protein
MRRESEARAKAIGVQLLPFEASVPEQLADVLAAAAQKHSDALVVLSDPMFNFNRRRLVEAAAQHRLPAVYEWHEFVEAGGLMAYGPNFTDLFRPAATYIDSASLGPAQNRGMWSMGNRPSCSFCRIEVRRASASIGGSRNDSPGRSSQMPGGPDACSRHSGGPMEGNPHSTPY